MVQKRLGRPRGFRPDEALAGALDVFWDRGYEATSLAQVESATGLARSSLYNSFGSKRELFVAALTAYATTMGDKLMRPLEGGAAGLDDVLAFLDRIEAHARGDGAPAGCLIVNSLVEVGGADPEVDGIVGSYLGRLEAALATALRRAAKQDEIDSEHVSSRAALLATLVIGISAVCRSGDALPLIAATRAQIEEWQV